jgi:FAD/FMN-containing dehydrogenase
LSNEDLVSLVTPPARARLRRYLFFLLITSVCILLTYVYGVVRTPVEPQTSPFLIRDVTWLNPIQVESVIAPTTTEEIVDAVKKHPGPISIGGARHSMGGQIAAAGSLHIDMRHFDKILAFVNISIRHVLSDPASVLPWARTEVFGFVVYYKQGTSSSAQAEVGAWTRALIDAALSLGGTYYLPYQLHATESQFRGAYPRAGEYFELKRRLDPTNKFRNQLWDKYYHPSATETLAVPHD